jgi:uncharacterized membrane protein YfcA
MLLLQPIMAILCGGLVGFTLGLIGGGGSILATPLLLYVVGLGPHQAIGTGALAVSVSAFSNFASHHRAGNVRWRSAALFAMAGTIGAFGGSYLGKEIDGKKLLFLFAILMIIVGIRMFRAKSTQALIEIPADFRYCNRKSIPRIVLAALTVGALSGFFGIGGGFLIVPSLLMSTGMPMLYAVGSSLLAVGTFGITTAANYALSGLIDWPVAAEYILGALIGGWGGMRLAIHLSRQKAALSRVFAILVCVVAVYMLYQTTTALG